MNAEGLSKQYKVRKMTNEDIDIILSLCVQNPLYYQYCPPFVNKELIKEDLISLPPNTTKEDKLYVGYFDNEKLIAVMDLIIHYPDEKTAFVGFFMAEKSIQGKGISSSIIAELVQYLTENDFEQIQLAWIKENPQAEHFWKKNRFEVIKETKSLDDRDVILAQRKI